jgi:hypothetical protein
MSAIKKLIFSLPVLLLPVAVHAQVFSSGSTGADGPLDLSTCPTISCVVKLPESGVLNYTTVNVPNSKILVFKRNSRNSPVTILAQSNVTIAGIVTVAATSDPDQPVSARTPGPGGFYGGQGGSSGFGPGGGLVTCSDQACTSINGRWIGPLSLVPIVGGSGGAGWTPQGLPCNGGGGGGAIVIASSTSITVTFPGFISADSSTGGCPGAGSGVGAGGAIRLIANSIGGDGRLTATGGSNGVIRLESPTGTNSYTGQATPAAVISPINPIIVSNDPPTLKITSVGGFAVPSYAGSRFDSVDLLLPSQLSDPIAVQVAGHNIPIGTQVDLGFFGSTSAVVTPGVLAGTLQNSTATATISSLNRSSVTFLLATASFTPPAVAQNFNPAGKDHVAKIRIESAVAAKPKFVFLRSDGSAIDHAKLRKKFLEQFGL